MRRGVAPTQIPAGGRAQAQKRHRPIPSPAGHRPEMGGRRDRSRDPHRGGTGSRRATDRAAAVRAARAHLAVLAGSHCDRRGGQPVHLVPARLHRHPGRDPAGHGDNPAHDRRGAPRDHHPAHGRLHQRLRRHEVGASQAVHRVRLAARRRVPGRDRQQQHAPCPRRVRDAAHRLHEHRARAVPGLRARPRCRAPGRLGERHGRDDADPGQRRPASSSPTSPRSRATCSSPCSRSRSWSW